MHKQTTLTQTRHVVPRIAEADSWFSRIYRGLLASLGFAGLLLVSAPAQAQAYLGTNLTPYAVLAGTTVTCAGAGLITGDVGVAPGAAIVGFPAPCTATGALNVPAVSDAGQADLLIAYGTLAGRACDVVLGPDLTGLTLTPGTYCVPAAATNLAGLLQLDAQGNPNAVWVFIMSSTLITSPGATVSVINGGGVAQACGAQWLVQTSATIDAGTTFLGNILALTNITINAGANLTGRALARNAAVNLIGGPSVSFAACGAGGGNAGTPPAWPIFGAIGGILSSLTGIPTLSEWAMILLASLLAIVGFAAMRRQSR